MDPMQIVKLAIPSAVIGYGFYKKNIPIVYAGAIGGVALNFQYILDTILGSATDILPDLGKGLGEGIGSGAEAIYDSAKGIVGDIADETVVKAGKWFIGLFGSPSKPKYKRPSKIYKPYSETEILHFLRGTYRILFHREPDTGGAVYWTDRMMAKSSTFSSIFKTLEGGSERKLVISARKMIKYTEEEMYDFVGWLYALTLHRRPDEGAMDYYIKRLSSGKSTMWMVVNLLDDGKERKKIMDSANYYTMEINVPNDEELSPLEAEANTFFEDLINTFNKYPGPDPSAIVEQKYTAKELATFVTSGYNYARVVKEKMTQPIIFEKKPQCNQIVHCIYRNLLRRKADDAGLRYWRNYLYKGKRVEDIVSNIDNAKERNAFRPTI